MPEADHKTLKSIAIILNPTAGRHTASARRNELERLLQERAAKFEGTRYEIIETPGPGTASQLAREAVERGADIVAAAGGDGTLCDVLNGIMGTHATLGVVPMGTGNDFIRTIGLRPEELERAVETLFCGTVRPVDVGRVHDRYFLNIAGSGFDAVVAERMNRGFRYLRGTSAYIASVVQSLFTFKAATLHMTLDGKPHTQKAMMCSVANASYYGGGMKIAPNARIDDGLFDVCLIGDVSKIEFLKTFPKVFAGTHVTHPAVTILRARHVVIESAPILPVFLDGDLYGTTPAEFTLLPGAISFLMPT